jgi:hypothetical protein
MCAIAVIWFLPLPEAEGSRPLSPVHLGDDIGRKAWYGSEELAVLVPKNGRWVGMGPANNYFDKFWLWRRGYDAGTEPRPDLLLVATRHGDPNSKFETGGGTNALNPFGFGDAMLMGVEFPSPGCWRVRVTYGKTKNIEIVVRVGANPAGKGVAADMDPRSYNRCVAPGIIAPRANTQACGRVGRIRN